MKPADIKRIAGIAQGSIDRIIGHWLPGKTKRQARELLALNPRRNDQNFGSFSINLDTAKWSDFADGAKGADLVSLVAYLDDCSQSDAAQRLAEFLNIQIEADQPERTATASKGTGKAKPSPESKKPQDGGTGDGWQCIMPVPSNAPKPPQSHPRHGKPTTRNEYRAIDGRLNFYHDRYEKKGDQKKQFSPLTLWQKETVLKWQYKAPTEPRPLYGLPGLAAYPDAVVFFCEGEKSCQALEILQPNHAVLCWQGGSQAVNKSDYSPLAGRAVVVWPDNDAPGRKASIALIDELKKVKAESIKVLAIDKLTLADNIPLPTGGDCADLVQSGWTTERFTDFLQRDGVLIDADEYVGNADKDSQEQTSKQPEDTETIERFTLFDKGLFVREEQRDGASRIRWICSPIKPLALVRTEHGREWGLLVWLVDPDGKEKRIVLAARQFNGDALAASGELLDAGLRIGTGNARKLVIEYLQTATPETRAKTTVRTGWHGVDDEMVFVLPETVISIGESREEWLFSNQLPDSNPYRQKGSLINWQENVAAMCAGNSRLVFSVCTAFASPLLHLLGLESGGFQLTGNSSTGKSTALQVAASVCGGRDYLQRWRSTDNGLEALAQSRSDSLLVLDEVKQLDGKIAAEAAYMLANSCGKVRANANGGARSLATWRLLFLSSGELSLSQHVIDAGKRVHAGMEIRLCDIPADAGKGMGILENIHGYESPVKFIEALNAATGKYYGTAFIEFIRHVLKNREAVPEMLRDCEKVFAESVLTDKASGQARRVAGRFALVAAAGELATQWNVTGWEPGEAMQATVACFKSWLAGYGGETDKESRDALKQVRQYLERHHEGRFSNVKRTLDKDHASKTLDRAGGREEIDGETHYYILTRMFEEDVCRGLNHKHVLKLLIERGFAKRGDGKNLKPYISLPGEKKRRMVHILPTIFDDE